MSSRSLVIVESPAKAKTLKKYLGGDFNVEASSGHLVDLPEDELGVDIEKNFKPRYVVIKEKKKFLDNLRKAAQGVKDIYLASDPDREGEAIAWHIAERLKVKDKAYRVLIHEITEKAVLEAIRNPESLSRERFEAQQARRILDRLVGYQVSPLLWKKVRGGLSAGRVQSVALRLAVEREREIENFKSEEYWTIEAELQPKENPTSFIAALAKFDHKKVKIKNENRAKRIVDALRNEAYRVLGVEKKERMRHSPAPFITSTLQQEASRKFKFPVKKTMSIAQRLYEGMDVGDEGPVGLITYMRTDSVRVSDHALSEVRGYINEIFGRDLLPRKPNTFRVKKQAQDAHEAIRPTSVLRTPDALKPYLSEEDLALYELIWQRFVASQMKPALYDQTTVEIEAGRGIFRVTGSVIKFPGFTILYAEGKEEGEDEKEGEEKDKRLPELHKGEELNLLNLEGKQHFTQPPLRFTESTLIKELEEKGIGRPSTYATIISTIQEREYLVKEKGRLRPTLLGRVITDLLVENFPEVLDPQFTAEMEGKLDDIEEGKVNWYELLSRFYGEFGKRLKEAENSMRNLKREGIPTEVKCDRCGAPMIIKWGKNGEFLSCSKFPKCKNAKPFEWTEDGEVRIKGKGEPEIRYDVTCDVCGKPMAVRTSRYGKVVGCTGYPECRNTKPIEGEEGRRRYYRKDKRRVVQKASLES